MPVEKRRLPSAYPTYANSSLITLPLLAIFIGRPLVLVKVVSARCPAPCRRWPSRLATCTARSRRRAVFVGGADRQAGLHAGAADHHAPARAQWSRPALPLIRGVRLNSPIQITAVSCKQAALVEVVTRALIAWSISGSLVSFSVGKMFWWLSQPPNRPR